MDKNFILSEKGNVFPKISSYEKVAMWKHSDLSFTWVNFEYPYLHTHNHYELSIIISGNICNFLNDKNYEMKVGDACIIRPKDCHKLYFSSAPDNDFLMLNFVIKQDYMNEVLKSYSPEFFDKMMRSTTLFFKIQPKDLEYFVNYCIKTQTLRMDNIENNVFLTKILLNKLLHIFFEQTFGNSDTELPAWLVNLLRIINNPKNNLSISDITKLSNYSYSRLSCIFKNYMGVSIKQYLLNVKMNYAKELLSSSKISILEISSLLGYDSLSHFNHIFKKTFNCTPKEIRKR